MKQFILAAGMLMSGTLHAQLTADLLIYYPFDGNANDYSGNGYHGTVNAMLTTDSLGNANAAYHFNGVNQYIDMPNIAALKPGFPMSFSYWIRLDELSSSQVIFTNNFTLDVHSGVWMNVGSTGIFSLGTGNAGATTPASRRNRNSATPLQANKWYHIVGIARDANDVDLYTDCVLNNGVYDGTSSGTLTYTVDGGSIGRKDANGVGVPEYYFKGSLDEFRYWSRALTVSEVNYLCELHLMGVNENMVESDYVVVYPNPAANNITFESAKSIPYQTVAIYSASGQLLHTQPFTTTISVEGFEAGMYTVILTDENSHVKTLKFIKE